MKLLQLIKNLERELREHGDISVILSAENEGDGENVPYELTHAVPDLITVEQDHDKEVLFVRIHGSDKE